jgi:hypothetical protein
MPSREVTHSATPVVQSTLRRFELDAAPCASVAKPKKLPPPDGPRELGGWPTAVFAR